MEKLPYGISNYEQLVKEGYYYVDKTQYIEKLENMSERTIMFLRPRKFGKTLFTSVLENYYDINKANEFETLFGDTYIGKKPTIGKNTYHILRFNFAGIDTSTTESTKIGFQKSIKDSIEKFIKQYSIDFYINSEEEAEWLLKNLLTAFSIQKAKEK